MITILPAPGNWKPFSTESRVPKLSLRGLHCWLWCKKCSKLCMWCISKAQCVCVYCCHVWSNLMKLLHLRPVPFSPSISFLVVLRLIKIWRHHQESWIDHQTWKRWSSTQQHSQRVVMATLREPAFLSHMKTTFRLHCFDLPLGTFLFVNAGLHRVMKWVDTKPPLFLRLFFCCQQVANISFFEKPISCYSALGTYCCATQQPARKSHRDLWFNLCSFFSFS